MSDRDVIGRLAGIARRLVGESTTVAVAAAQRIDDDTYTADAMAQTAGALTGLVVKAWLDLARLALNEDDAGRGLTGAQPVSPLPPPTPGVVPIRVAGNGLGSAVEVFGELTSTAFRRNLDAVSRYLAHLVPGYASVVTDEITTVIKRAADQARTEVDDAATQLDADGYGPDDLARTLTRLADVALVNAIELIGTAVVGPSRYESSHITSEYFTVPHAVATAEHDLALLSPLELAGGGDVITEDRISFDPADCVLPAGTDRFRIRVKPAGLGSGIYQGWVWAPPRDPAQPPDRKNPVRRDLVPVVIGL